MLNSQKSKNLDEQADNNSPTQNRLNDTFKQARQQLNKQLGVVRERTVRNTQRYLTPGNSGGGNSGRGGTSSQPGVGLPAPVRPVGVPVPKQPSITDLQTFQEQKTVTGRMRPPADLKALGLATPADEAPTVSFRTGQISQYLKSSQNQITTLNEEADEAATTSLPNPYQPHATPYIADIPGGAGFTTSNTNPYTGGASDSRNLGAATASNFATRPMRPIDVQPELHTSFLRGYDATALPKPLTKKSLPIIPNVKQPKKRRRFNFIALPERTRELYGAMVAAFVIIVLVVFTLLYLRSFLDRAPNQNFSVIFANVGEGSAYARTATAKGLGHELADNYRDTSGIPGADLRLEDNVINSSSEATAILSRSNSDVAVWGEYEPSSSTFLLHLKLNPNGPLDPYTFQYLNERIYNLSDITFKMPVPTDWRKPTDLSQLLEAIYSYYNGTYDKAIVDYGNLIIKYSSDPTNEVYLRFLRGNTLYAQGNFSAALLDFNQADTLLQQLQKTGNVDQNLPDPAYIYNNRGVVYAGTFDQKINDPSNAPQPNNPKMAQIVVYNVANAESNFQQAIDTNNKLALPYLNQARLQIARMSQENNPANVINLQHSIETNLNQAIDLSQAQNQPLAGAYYYRSQLYYAEGKLDATRADAERAKELAPNLALAYNQLGWTDLNLYLQNHDQKVLNRAYDEFQNGENVAGQLRDQYRNQWNQLSHTDGSVNLATVADARANDFQSQYDQLDFGLARATFEKGKLQGTNQGSIFDKLGRAAQGHQLWLDQARDKFVAYTNNHPNDAEGHFYLGEIYYLLGQGNWEQAEKDAIDRNPTEFKYYQAMADHYAAQNNSKQAIALYQRYLKNYPNSHNYEVHLGLAGLYLQAGQAALAAGEADAATRLQANSFGGYLVAGQAYTAQQDYNRGVVNLQHAVSLDPASAEAHYQLGQALFKAGQPDSALDQLQVAIDKATNPAPNHQADPNLVSQASYQRGLIFQQQNKLDRAAPEFQRAVNTNNQNIDAYLRLGDVYTQLNRLDEATNAYNAALKVPNPSPVAAYKIGLVQESQHNYKDALNSFNKALSMQANMSEAQLEKAKVQLAQGDYNGAIDSANKYLAANPQNGEGLRVLAEAQRSKGDYNAAIDSYKKTLAVQPQNPSSNLGLGICYENQKNYNEALNWINQAIKIKPDYADAYVEQGRVLMAMGQSDQAFNSFQQAIKINPKDAQAFTALADVYSSRGQNEVAIENYNAAIKLDPHETDAHYQLGLLYNARHDTDQGIAELETAVKQQANWPEAWYNLGKLYEEKGNEAKAQTALTNALSNRPTYPEAHYELGNVLLTENNQQQALAEYQKTIDQSSDPKSELAMQAWLRQGSIYESLSNVPQAKAAYTHVRDAAPQADLKQQAINSLSRVGS